MQYIPYGDYHMHSKYSDGRATIAELAKAAKELGLKEIAITDHGPRNIGTGVKSAGKYLEIKEEAAKLNKDQSDFKILVGAEADVISCDGDIDVPEEIYKELDILLIGLHPYALPNNLRDIWQLTLQNLIHNYTGYLKGKVIESNTKALKNAIKRHRPYAVTHPGLKMPVDLEEIADACVKTGTLFEINTGHDFQKPQQIEIVASYGTAFIVNSDAHYTGSVGKLDPGFKILLKAKISPEKIANIVH
ncbi:MAG: putative hydrolase [Clostridia bacterium]|jgi:putative hydrolase|nr:hypothetical protein [Clostridiales bacterium]MDK2985016.1 putative hydrolase [Clostridia bacterium]